MRGPIPEHEEAQLLRECAIRGVILNATALLVGVEDRLFVLNMQKTCVPVNHMLRMSPCGAAEKNVMQQRIQKNEGSDDA